MIYKLTNGKLTKILIILETLINIACYRFLPDNVGIQFNASGDISRTIPKLLFIFFIPLITLLLNFYYKRTNSSPEIKTTLFTVIFFVINLVTLFLNLR
ncbi:MAG TPA: DUF1648 domain-containing protein [Clostridiales bacterium]|nr:DUF1648 domain-containing protein [Clostridiales bacterium]